MAIAPENTRPTQATAAASPTAFQAAWQRFVDRVARGAQIDSAGQYVAKAMALANNQAERRAARPKPDAATAEFAQHYRVRNGEIVSLGKSGSAGKLYVRPPLDTSML